MTTAYAPNMQADVKCHIYYVHKFTLPLQPYTPSREDKGPLLTLSISKWIDSCQNRASSDKYHMTISRTHMKPVVLAVYVSWSSMSHLPTIIETTLAAKSKSIYSCQNEASTDRYQVTVLRDHFSTKRRKQGTADWKSSEKCIINISHQNR